TNSELVCLDWPFCNNDAIGLPSSFNQWVQMGHRFAAALIFLWILYIAIHAIRNYKNQRVFYWGWIIALILVSSQVITGMTVVLTRLNLYLALLHS
ncbi:COX15/CtaA family protein, partial [Microvirga sp. 3-52]|nr:COX15/CtaA family protein [Microvirga sp. 3-52]